MKELNNELYKIKQIIFDKTGIVIKNNKLKYLEEQVLKVIDKYQYSNINDYISDLNRNDISDERFNLLINSLKIDESYFFRSKEQINFLKKFFIPKLLDYKRSRNNNNLFFWSAGCSKGQEAYTLGILLYEYISSINELDKWNVSVFGSDIDNESLEIAKNGEYTKWSLRGVDDIYIENYFIKKPKDNYIVKAEIKKNIKFRNYNLISKINPSFLHDIKCDLILCRNVFIYFEKSIIMQIAEKFSDLLTKNGCLLIGDTEKIELNKKIKLRFHQNKKYNFYVNKQSKLFEEYNVSFHESHAKKTEALGVYNTNKVFSDDSLIFEDNVKEKIHYLANTNKLDDALQLCNKELQNNTTDQDLHLLQALIFFEKGNEEEFEKSLRKTLFLDPGNVVARYYLGIYLYQKGLTNKGLSNLKIALSNAEKKNENDNISLLKNITYKEFVTTLKAEIKSYE